MAEHLAAALAAATAAADTAMQALAEVRRAQVQGLATKPKELELSGRPEEDRRLWADWRFAMTHYLGSKDQQYTSEIKAALERHDALVMNTLTAETQARSRQLFTYLCGNVRGRLLTMLKDLVLASTSNGYEAMRRFHLDIEPRWGAAALGLLETILMVPAPPKGTNLRDAIISYRWNGCSLIMRRQATRSSVSMSRSRHCGDCCLPRSKSMSTCWSRIPLPMPM